MEMLMTIIHYGSWLRTGLSGDMGGFKPQRPNELKPVAVTLSKHENSTHSRAKISSTMVRTLNRATKMARLVVNP